MLTTSAAVAGQAKRLCCIGVRYQNLPILTYGDHREAGDVSRNILERVKAMFEIMSRILITNSVVLVCLLSLAPARAEISSSDIQQASETEQSDDAPSVERWRGHYNTVRLHSSLGYQPPAPEAIQPRSLRLRLSERAGLARRPPQH